MSIWKKLGATTLAALLVLTGQNALTAQAAVDVDSLADGTAYLNINNSDWGEFDAEYTNAEITGDGQYTVSMVAAEAQNLAQFNALQVKNGESVMGNGSIITIDEIKLNGEAIELQGPSYTCSADGAGVDTRVNLYNEWNSPVDANGAVNADTRAVVDPTTTTAMLWTAEQLEGVQSIEVTFTVSNFGETKAEEAAVAYELSEDAGRAYLNINNSDWSEFEKEVVDAQVTGDGTYTVSMAMAEAQNLAQFNALEIVEGEYVIGNGAVVTVDEIKLNGEVIELQGPSYTCSADGGGVTTRVNLYNEWNSPVDGDGNIPADVRAAVDPATCTAMLWTSEQLEGVSSIEVTFTVSGFGTFVTTEDTAATSAEPVDLNGVYHAYIGLQSPKYTFRNAVDDASYGAAVEDGKYFNQLTGWDEDDNAVTVPGSFVDAEIKGNGTYTVAATGIEWPEGEFETQDYMNLIFVSTDIPNSGEITISNVQLNIGGSSVELASAGAILSPDNVNYINMLIQNIWNSDITTIGYYQVPFSEISITFDVSGFAYDQEAAVETAVEETKTETETVAEPVAEKVEEPAKKSNTGLIVGIVAAVVAICAVVGVVVAKKKKN